MVFSEHELSISPILQLSMSNDDIDIEDQQSLLRRPSDMFPSYLRNHVIAAIGEFVGTFMFLLFAYIIAQSANLDKSLESTQHGPTTSQTTMISFGFGFSVMCQVFVFFRVSGGHLNPAVTLCLLLTGNCPIVRSILVMITQVAAGIAAAEVANVLTPGHVLFNNALADGESRTKGLFLEAFATALLTMVVLFMAVEKHRATHMAPLAIGVALFIGHLFCVPLTGAGINPARSFGPNVAMKSFPTYHWIYWLGPVIGSILSSVLYYILKFLDYETCNPGQDADSDSE